MPHEATLLPPVALEPVAFEDEAPITVRSLEELVHAREPRVIAAEQRPSRRAGALEAHATHDARFAFVKAR